jgi:hypothetical protein
MEHRADDATRRTATSKERTMDHPDVMYRLVLEHHRALEDSMRATRAHALTRPVGRLRRIGALGSRVGFRPAGRRHAPSHRAA